MYTICESGNHTEVFFTQQGMKSLVMSTSPDIFDIVWIGDNIQSGKSNIPIDSYFCVLTSDIGNKCLGVFTIM